MQQFNDIILSEMPGLSRRLPRQLDANSPCALNPSDDTAISNIILHKMSRCFVDRAGDRIARACVLQVFKANLQLSDTVLSRCAAASPIADAIESHSALYFASFKKQSSSAMSFFPRYARAGRLQKQSDTTTLCTPVLQAAVNESIVSRGRRCAN